MCEFCKHIGTELDMEIKCQELRTENGNVLFSQSVCLDDMYRRAYNNSGAVDLKVDLEHEVSDGPFMTQRIRINYCPMCGRHFKEEEA